MQKQTIFNRIINWVLPPKVKPVQPCFDHNYACESCGNTSGSVHPETGFCFVCGADDFIKMEFYKAGIRGEAYITILQNTQ